MKNYELVIWNFLIYLKLLTVLFLFSSFLLFYLSLSLSLSFSLSLALPFFRSITASQSLPSCTNTSIILFLNCAYNDSEYLSTYFGYRSSNL